MAFFGKAQAEIDRAVTHAADKASLKTEMRRPAKLVPAIDCDVMDEAALIEYRAIANEVGLSPDDLAVEEFRLFLAKHDIPTFAVSEVVQYMDELTARDNPSKLGWHWCPVRNKDREASLRFGTPSIQGMQNQQSLGMQSGVAQAVTWVSGGLGQISDRQLQQMMQLQQAQWSQSGQASAASDYYNNLEAVPYARTIPLHALKKIALVEREFGAGKAAFLVTDYTTQPHVVVNPDPFLMAVIPNSAVAHGKGRFIIDVWDEPGFGIGRMVK